MHGCPRVSTRERFLSALFLMRYAWLGWLFEVWVPARILIYVSECCQGHLYWRSKGSRQSCLSQRPFYPLPRSKHKLSAAFPSLPT